MRLRVGIQEAKHNWTKELYKKTIDDFLDNTWNDSWNYMYFNSDLDNHIDLDRESAVTHMTKSNNEFTVSFSDTKLVSGTQNADKVKLTINCIAGKHAIMLNLPEKIMKELQYSVVLDYFIEHTKNVHTLESLDISHFIGNNEFNGENGITKAKSCGIRTPYWIHILGPSLYKDYTTKEKLLGVPAYKVEELHDDIVMFQTYKNPFEYDTPEAINYMREVADYLRTNRNW